jgi:hypothetical protein
MARAAIHHQDRHMSKRAVASVLWFAATWFTYEIAWSMVGLPRMAGPILAAALAMTVLVDPLHLFWPCPEVATRRSVDPGVQALDTGIAKSH